jgi:hypothetical protein
MTQVVYQIMYDPHSGQQLFHNSRARFKMLTCGRRWGKTYGGANEALRVIAELGRPSVGFIVAPTYWHTRKCWREFLHFCPKEIIASINRSERLIALTNGTLIWFKSADNPDSLRSEGLDWLWVDECAEVKEEAWNLALRPALMDKKGVAWFTTTPKGRNWYFQLWTRGQDAEQREYESWNFPSVGNPHLDPLEIAKFKKDMPDLAYRQEILGEFLDDIGAVFRQIERHIMDIPLEPVRGRTYVVGCDVAKYQDYTVLVALDVNSGHLCGFDRYQQLDWVLQRKRIVAFCRRYNNARLLIDSSGVGDPVYDELRRCELNVQGYKFTSATKADLIENLSVKLDDDAIKYPRIPVLLSELGMFGYETLPSGTIRYRAPGGYHDDCVVALALAAWQQKVPKGAFF